MTRFYLVVLPILCLLFFSMFGLFWVATAAHHECTPAANAAWLKTPMLTEEVPGTSVGVGTPCQFHESSWQTFLFLMSPLEPIKPEGKRNYEDYPIVGETLCDPVHCPSLVQVNKRSGWFARTAKPSAASRETKQFRFVGPTPKFIDMSATTICGARSWDDVQPDEDKALYDQDGNITLYNMRYTRKNMCGSFRNGNFPSRISDKRKPLPFEKWGVMELKFSWRQIGHLTKAEKDRYFHIDVDVPDFGKRTLGLVGLHIARRTKWHDSMIWATFEHRDNAPDCNAPTRTAGWSFLSKPCAKCLQTNSHKSDPIAACRAFDYKGQKICSNLNRGVSGPSNPSPIGKPTQVCRLNPRGGGSKQSKTAIKKLNASVSNLLGALSKQEARYRSMLVWQNYFLVGTLWLSDPTMPSTHSAPPHKDNFNGSKALANVTMETFSQENKNCFSCHKFLDPAKASAFVSHILPFR